MNEILPCTFEGCDAVFSRPFQLKKHIATHENPASLFYCTTCDFYTLNPRNLEVHIATHTGKKIYKCPDTMNVCEPSGELPEVPCDYRTGDRALLTRHRRKAHEYIPRPRAAPQPATTFTFVPYPPPSYSATTSGSNATSNTTSRVSKKTRKRKATAKRPKSSKTRAAGNAQDATSGAEHAAPGSSLPSTSQEGAEEHGHWAHVESPVTTAPSSVGSSSAMSPASNEYTSLDANGQQAYVGLPDATGTLAASSSGAVLAVPNEGIFLDTHGQSADVESSHVVGSSSTTPSASDQGMLTDGLFDPTLDFDQWMAKLGAEESTAPPMTVEQYPAFLTGGFWIMPGIDSRTESDWNDLWARLK